MIKPISIFKISYLDQKEKQNNNIVEKGNLSSIIFQKMLFKTNNSSVSV